MRENRASHLVGWKTHPTILPRSGFELTTYRTPWLQTWARCPTPLPIRPRPYPLGQEGGCDWNHRNDGRAKRDTKKGRAQGNDEDAAECNETIESSRGVAENNISNDMEEKWNPGLYRGIIIISYVMELLGTWIERYGTKWNKLGSEQHSSRWIGKTDGRRGRGKQRDT